MMTLAQAAAMLDRVDRDMQALRGKLRQMEVIGDYRKTILNGSGPPTAGLGLDGDFYIDTAATALYGPKAAGAWGSPTILIGSPGTDGSDGTDGVDGSDGLNGADGLSMGQSLIAPAAGAFLANATNASALSAVAQVADRVTIAPFVPRHAMTIDQLGCSISTLLAASSVKLVLYDSDAQGRPTTILRETATIDSATTGTKFASIASFTFAAGKVYWLGLRASATQSVRTVSSAATPVLAATNAATPVLQTTLTKTETYANAAANWTYANSQLSNLSPPLILMRVA